MCKTREICIPAEIINRAAGTGWWTAAACQSSPSLPGRNRESGATRSDLSQSMINHGLAFVRRCRWQAMAAAAAVETMVVNRFFGMVGRRRSCVAQCLRLVSRCSPPSSVASHEFSRSLLPSGAVGQPTLHRMHLCHQRSRLPRLSVAE